MPAPPLRHTVIVDALQLACRAPSLHNSQPWRWVVAERTVELFADSARLVRSSDTTGREALISCGAMLHHFRIAMAAAGWNTTVHRFPDPADHLHLARIEFSPASSVSDADRRRADAILLRRTDRLPFAGLPQAREWVVAIVGQPRESTVTVDVVADELRAALAEASQLTDALRLHDAKYHAELSWWTSSFATDDGIPESSLVSPAESDRVDIGRNFPVTGQPERRAELGDDRATILVISTRDDSARSVLCCGETLSEILLDATAAGLSTCTLSHITEVPAGRDLVSSLIGGGTAQVLVRVGLAPALEASPPPTPRRPMGEIVEIRREQSCPS